MSFFLVHVSFPFPYGGTAPLIKNKHMFCARSQNINTFLKNVSYSELSKKLNNDVEILVGQAIFKL